MADQDIEIYARILPKDRRAIECVDARISYDEIIDVFTRLLKERTERLTSKKQLQEAFVNTVKASLSSDAQKKQAARKIFKSGKVVFEQPEIIEEMTKLVVSPQDIDKIAISVLSATLKKCCNAVELRLRNK
jgi:hypothetical protein